MADRTIPLSDLIAEGRGAVEEIVALGVRGGPDAAAVCGAMRILGDTAQSDLRAACDKDLVALLVEGWGRAEELRDYGDRFRHPPPSRTTMVLGTHTLEVAIDPRLTLVVGEALRFPLRFLAVFFVMVEAARLNIVDGAIAAADLGNLQFSAKLRWGAAEVPLPLRTHEIALPGHFAVDPPFAIRR
jgi:hypothetical protein